MLFDRRTASTLALTLLAALALVAGCSTDDTRATLSTNAYFPQSVASGDPRPDSVVFWTRLVDPDGPERPRVTLVVARDPELEDVVYERSLVAHPRHDGCVKHRVTGLSAGRHYWYRFVYSNDDGVASSNVGRTKTAPAATSNVPVRWAFFSCQDYVGRWYNSYVHLLEHYGPDEESDLDFLVFLGDYIYENTGDPSFQTPGAERGFVFADIAGAIRRGTATEPFYSAKSLANYRTLYKVYRSDRMLQRLHERFPMIAVWDDHEFSDDSHGATGTYFNGRRNELDAPRRRNAEQAFFEYMPCEVGLDAQGFLAIENGDLYPNTRIYDRFRFGANCEVFLTDLRTYRPDHLIPEDAFPGTVILDETMAGPAGVEPYVDFRSRAEPHATLNALVRPTYQAIVTGMLQQEDPERFANDPAAAGKLAGELTAGKQAARFINGVFEGAQLPPPIDLATQAILPRGLAYVTLGKQSIFDSVGSRYAVSHDLLPVVDAVTGYGLDDLLGAPQRAWLEAGVSGSGARWKIIGNSVSAVPMIFDFTNPAIPLPTGFPDSLRARLQLNADQWDGFPTAKREFLKRHVAHAERGPDVRRHPLLVARRPRRPAGAGSARHAPGLRVHRRRGLVLHRQALHRAPGQLAAPAPGRRHDGPDRQPPEHLLAVEPVVAREPAVGRRVRRSRQQRVRRARGQRRAAPGLVPPLPGDRGDEESLRGSRRGRGPVHHDGLPRRERHRHGGVTRVGVVSASREP
jgi:alkaline phosphatase D